MTRQAELTTVLSLTDAGASFLSLSHRLAGVAPAVGRAQARAMAATMPEGTGVAEHLGFLRRLVQTALTELERTHTHAAALSKPQVAFVLERASMLVAAADYFTSATVDEALSRIASAPQPPQDNSSGSWRLFYAEVARYVLGRLEGY